MLKWKLDLVLLEIVLILTKDRCTVCAERTIGSEVVLDTPMELLGDVGHVNLLSLFLVIVLVWVQDRCTVCAKRTIGSKIILDASDGTPR
jgi:hypothetical protein